MDRFDMLVKLYELDIDWSFIQSQAEKGITIRKPIAPEIISITRWIKENFAEPWASEFQKACFNTPVTAFIATQEKEILGFACYDATHLGFFGPTGVSEQCRGKGTGAALLKACIQDMKLKGYGYAIIGGVGPAEFYKKQVNAVPIPDSFPGVYKNLITK